MDTRYNTKRVNFKGNKLEIRNTKYTLCIKLLKMYFNIDFKKIYFNLYTIYFS